MNNIWASGSSYPLTITDSAVKNDESSPSVSNNFWFFLNSFLYPVNAKFSEEMGKVATGSEFL